jgi:hypothetical protein
LPFLNNIRGAIERQLFFNVAEPRIEHAFDAIIPAWSFALSA